MPISVSIGDTLDREPTHICEKNPAELISKFMKELQRREKNIGERVREEFLPKDLNLLPKDQQKKFTNGATRFLWWASTQARTT